MKHITKNASELIDLFSFSDFECKKSMSDFIGANENKNDTDLMCEIAQKMILDEFSGLISSDKSYIEKKQLEKLVACRNKLDEIEDEEEKNQYIESNLNFPVDIFLF